MFQAEAPIAATLANGMVVSGTVDRLLIAPDAIRLVDFKRALGEVLLNLAHQVVKDGEGARKFVEVTVTGAENAKAAKRIVTSKSFDNSILCTNESVLIAEEAIADKLLRHLRHGKRREPRPPHRIRAC